MPVTTQEQSLTLILKRKQPSTGVRFSTLEILNPARLKMPLQQAVKEYCLGNNTMVSIFLCYRLTDLNLIYFILFNCVKFLLINLAVDFLDL